MALVVDDDPASRSIARKFLESEEWHVEEAENGAEGLKKALATGFELILLDLMMPVMDGFEFLRRLRQGDGPSATSPVVVITALDLSADERARLMEGTKEIVSKSGGDIGQALYEVRKLLAAAGFDGKDNNQAAAPKN